jgi:hypothetical protein
MNQDTILHTPARRSSASKAMMRLGAGLTWLVVLFLAFVHIHLAVDQLTAALERVYQDKAAPVEVTEFFGRDETLAHLSLACAELLSARTATDPRNIPQPHRNLARSRLH